MLLYHFLAQKGVEPVRDWESFQFTGAPDRLVSGLRHPHLLQTSVLVIPVVNGVVQEGLLFRRRVLRLVFVAEAGHLRLRGVSNRRLGAVVDAIAEVDHKT